MKLELQKVKVNDVVLGDALSFKSGTLTICAKSIIDALKEDVNIADVKVSLAKPGEKIRIIPVKDVIQPRVKINGGSGGFPGVTTTPTRAGEGQVKVLDGAAVVTIGDIVGFQEGIIDMWGEGAKWTPFSKTLNIVIDIKPIEDLEPHVHEKTVRLAGLKAAELIGAVAKDAPHDQVDVYEMEDIFTENKKYPHLPKVLYVEMLISQGLLHDDYIYGVNSQQILPTLLHPNEELDGAVVSGNCVAACDKITTYQHQNNSVIEDLYKKHGKEINFLGVILSPELTTLDGKFRTSDFTAKLCENLGAEGVIISEEGYGNPDSDLLMICKKLELAGIKTVLITDECAGWDGMSQPLADTTPEAVAVVSTGNVSHVVHLEAADQVLGNKDAIITLAGGWEGCINEDGSLICELNAIIGATSEIGYHNLTIDLY